MGWGNKTNYFSSKWSNYTLLQCIMSKFILMVQPYEVEAITDYKEGKKEQYGSLRYQNYIFVVGMICYLFFCGRWKFCKEV